MRHSYIGALHIHSTFSDGRKDIPYIIKQAAKAGLKWIIITDHNNLDGLSYEGFHNGVCVIVGTEITPPTANHLLAFNTKEPIDYKIGTKAYIDEAHKQGGVCFAAHPDESIHRDNKQMPLRWEDWSIDTIDGLEIWNYLTDWTDNFSINKSPVIQYIKRHKNISGPTKNLLAWWDRLNNKKDNIIPAIGGVDAHAFQVKNCKLPLKISDYYDFFSSLNNILYLNEPLSKNFETAKEQVISALKSGNNIIINRNVTKNINLEFFAETKGEKKYCGEVLSLGNYSKLFLKLPKKATVRLFRNGVLIYEKDTAVLEFDRLKSGKYRIEIYSKNIPWIFTNPIKIIEE